MRTFLPLTLLILVLLPVASSSGQNPLESLFRELLRRDEPARPFDRDRDRNTVRATAYEVNAAERGDGTLGMRGPNRKLTGARVSLTRDGRCEVIFSGERDHRFRGTWRRGRANQALITITHAFHRTPATGTGVVYLQGDTFTRIDIEGNCQALQGDYHARFETRAHRDRDRNRFSMESVQRGRGSIGMAGPNRRLSQARVRLQQDGDARITFYGDDTYECVGSWTARSANVIDLRINRGPDGRRMDATGSITLAQGSRTFSKIEILGDSPSLGGRVRMSFDASSRQHVDRRYAWRGARADVPGRGTLGMRGPNRSLDRAAVTLYENGNARIQLQGERQYDLQATWFGCQDTGTLELEIDRMNNLLATGTGKLFLDGNRVVGIECEGRADATGGDFSVRYRLGNDRDSRRGMRDRRDYEERGSRQRAVIREIKADAAGAGRYQSRGTDAAVNRASVLLRNDGTASLSFTGRDTFRFAGTWRHVKEGVASIEVSRLQGRIAVQGTGTVQYRGDDVMAVQVSGSSRQRGAFSLSFRRQEQRRGVPWRLGRGIRGIGDLF